MRVHEVARLVLNGLFAPQTCATCGCWVVNQRAVPLCNDCFRRLAPLTDPVCHCCGIPLPGVLLEESGTCSGCRGQPPPLPRCRSWGLYEGRLRDLIHLYKFRSARALAWPLSDCLFECLQKHFADLEFKGLVPVPSHPGRIRARGFDAVGLMARRLSRKCRVPVANALARVRATRPQFGLNGPARVRNLRGAFRMKRGEQLPVGNLLVLDDVLTTGTTISELASVIAAQRGVREVCALTLARTPLFGDSGC